MADQCGNCDYMRTRTYGEKSVMECRNPLPWRVQAQIGVWPQIEETDWCAQYQIVGWDDPLNWSVQGLMLSDVQRTKIAETPGYVMYVVGIDVTNTIANKPVMIQFFNGAEGEALGVASVAANGSDSKQFLPPIMASSGELWAQLNTAGGDVYVYAQIRRGRPIEAVPIA